jgi:hypothetical protein
MPKSTTVTAVMVSKVIKKEVEDYVYRVFLGMGYNLSGTTIHEEGSRKR